MRVKIISGNQAGTVQDLPQVEAEVAISTGYAERVVELDGPRLVEVAAATDELLTADEAPVTMGVDVSVTTDTTSVAFDKTANDTPVSE
jgi:translation initiation factor 2 gamma subunit (eIF-2gamma)